MTPTIALGMAHPAPSSGANPNGAINGAALDVGRLSMRGYPDPLFHVVEQHCEHDEEDQDPETNSLSLGKVRFSRPAQEGGNVLGVIFQSRLRAVLVSDSAIGDWLRHRNLVAGIVQIPLQVIGLRIAG